MYTAQRSTVLSAICLAIEERERYERHVLKYFTKSAHLTQLEELAQKLRDNETVLIED